MARGGWAKMLADATERSRAADADWRHTPDDSGSPRGAKRPETTDPLVYAMTAALSSPHSKNEIPNDQTDYPAPPVRPDGWGTW